MTDDKNKLYNALNSKNLYTKSFDEFQSQFSDEESQSKLYSGLKEKGFYTKSLDDFKSQFGFKKKDSTTESPSEIDSSESSMEDSIASVSKALLDSAKEYYPDVEPQTQEAAKRVSSDDRKVTPLDNPFIGLGFSTAKALYNTIVNTTPSRLEKGALSSIGDDISKIEEILKANEGKPDDTRIDYRKGSKRSQGVAGVSVPDIEITTLGKLRDKLAEKNKQLGTKIKDIRQLDQQAAAFSDKDFSLSDGVSINELGVLVGEQLPQMATSVVMPFVGSYLQSYGGIYYESVKKKAAKNFNVPEDEVTPTQISSIIQSGEDDAEASQIGAMAVASLDLIGMTGIGKAVSAPLKAATRSIIQNGVKAGGKYGVKQLLKLGGKKILAPALAEGVTEGAQSTIEQSVPLYNNDEDIAENLDWHQTWEEALAGMIIGGGAGTVSTASGIGTSKPKLTSKQVDDVIESGDKGALKEMSKDGRIDWDDLPESTKKKVQLTEETVEGKTYTYPSGILGEEKTTNNEQSESNNRPQESEGSSQVDGGEESRTKEDGEEAGSGVRESENNQEVIHQENEEIQREPDRVTEQNNNTSEDVDTEPREDDGVQIENTEEGESTRDEGQASPNESIESENNPDPQQDDNISQADRVAERRSSIENVVRKTKSIKISTNDSKVAKSLEKDNKNLKGLDRMLKATKNFKGDSDTDLQVVITPDKKSFNEVVKEISEKESSRQTDEGTQTSAIYDSSSHSIVLDQETMDNIDQSHEFLHPVLGDYLRQNPQQATRIANEAISKDESLKKFIDQYSEGSKNEEAVVEGLARYISREIEKPKLTTKFKRVINDILQSIGIDRSIIVNGDEDYRGLASKMVEGFTTGRPIQVDQKPVSRSADLSSRKKPRIPVIEIEENTSIEEANETFEGILSDFQKNYAYDDLDSKNFEEVLFDNKVVEAASQVTRAVSKTLGLGDKLLENTSGKVIDKFEGWTRDGVRSWLKSDQNAKSTIANSIRGIVPNLALDKSDQDSRRQFEGEKNYASETVKRLGDGLYKLMGGEQNDFSLQRVHSVMDNEVSEKKSGESLDYNDLTEREKEVHDILRSLNNYIHHTNYKNGFIDKDTYEKYKGSYIGRAYHEIEFDKDMKQIFKSLDSKMNDKIYSFRKDLDDIDLTSIQDPVYLTTKRLAQTMQNVAVSNYANSIDQKGIALTTEQVNDKGLQGAYRQLKAPSGFNYYGSLTNKWVPNIYAEDFKGFEYTNKAMQTVFDAFRWYDRAAFRQVFKKGLTVYNPITRLGNIMGNFYFSINAGVDPLTFAKNRGRAKKSLKNFDENAQQLMKAGILSKSNTEVEFSKSIRKLVDKIVPNKTISNKIKQWDKWAVETYGKTDDVGKLSAYISLRESYGISHKDAVDRVAQGFQNYATVGKSYSFGSMIPVVGQPFVRFKADLARMGYNNLKNRPLTAAAYFGGLYAANVLLSDASGEGEETRKARTSRQFIPKVPTPFGKIPLVWQVPMIGEVNVARYATPFYTYDLGRQGSASAEISTFLPIQVEVGEEKVEDKMIPVRVPTNDPTLSWIVDVFLTDSDFRGVSVSNPERKQAITAKEKWANRAVYAFREGIPLFPSKLMHDLYRSSKGQDDYYGRNRDITESLMSRIVKIQDFGGEEVVEDLEKQMYYLDRDIDKLNDQIRNWEQQGNKELDNLLSNSNITPDQYESKSEKIISKIMKETQKIEIKIDKLNKEKFKKSEQVLKVLDEID